MDSTGYPHYTPCSSNNTLSTNQCVSNNNGNVNPPSPDPTCYQNHIENSPPQMIQKRKRSVNPQADENFIRALEAVRYGGIGFCKAARMYGVNNRTLWLEYKKRGYPNFRLSIKNRKQEASQAVDMNNHASCSSPPPPSQPPENPVHSVQRTETEEMMPPNTVSLISSAFFDNKHLDLTPVLQRPKYLDAAVMNAQPTISFQNLNFEHM